MARKKDAFYVPQEKLAYFVEGLTREDEDVQEAFEQTFKSHIREYIARKIGNEEDVEELVMNTMYVTYTSIGSLNKPLALVGWVYEIAHRQIYHFYKDKENEQKRMEKAHIRASKEAVRKKKLELRQSSGIDWSIPDMQDLVNQLPEKQREAAILRKKGYKVSEIAEIQGVSEGTVKSRLNYARKKIVEKSKNTKS